MMKLPRRWITRIRTQLVMGVGLVMLIATLLHVFAFSAIIQGQEIDNATRTLDIALKAAWAQFNARPLLIEGVLQQAARSQQLRTAIREDQSATLRNILTDWQLSYPYVDFWLVTDDEGKVLSRSGSLIKGDRWVFADLVAVAQQQTDSLISTELMPAESLAREGRELAAKAEISLLPNGGPDGRKSAPEKIRDGLVTLVLTPVKGPDDTVAGTLVAGMLLNHNSWIPDEYTKQVPNTYLSIGSQGVRIASNIETDELSRPRGSLQETTLFQTTEKGEEYRGSMVVNGQTSLLAVDPIFNHAGQVVGNIGVGSPITKFAAYGAESARRALWACLLVFAIAMVLADLMAGAIVNPIVKLRTLTQSVASNAVDPDAIVWEEPRTPVEVRELADTMTEMARALKRKGQEAYSYADALALEKAHLEEKIRERTQELAETVAQLQVTNKYKSQFLANMSHELRTPLNAIIGFARLLYDQVAGELNRKQMQYTRNILSGGNHLLELINDILDLIKIEQGKENFYPEFTPPGEALAAVTRLLGQQAKDKGIEMTVQVEPALPEAYWDVKRVKQILANLISNAIKFTPRGGQVEVSASREGESILFKVADTGIGIKPEDHERVFLAFEQADSSLTRRFEGAGLGLAISKQLVELHNGNIWLDSVPGAGTTVYVLLPITPFRPEEGKDRSGNSAESPDRGR